MKPLSGSVFYPSFKENRHVSIVSPNSYTFFLTLLYQVAERMSYISIQSVPRVFSEVLVFLGIKPQYY